MVSFLLSHAAGVLDSRPQGVCFCGFFFVFLVFLASISLIVPFFEKDFHMCNHGGRGEGRGYGTGYGRINDNGKNTIIM